MNASSANQARGTGLAAVLRQVVAIDTARRNGAPQPALSAEHTQQLVLVLTDALLAERRQRCAGRA